MKFITTALSEEQWEWFDDWHEQMITLREHCIPILEKQDVDLVIEAHDHAYKKTDPIRNNQDEKTELFKNLTFRIRHPGMGYSSL